MTIIIADALRTPIGAFQGKLSKLTAPDLGAAVITGLMERLKLKSVDEVLLGCVLTAGLGQAPARQAALKAGLGYATNATTISKVCGSGMKAIMIAHDQIVANPNSVIIAGGMESMTNAPYLLKKARSGERLGHGHLLDHMFLDGLEDAYESGKLMGVFAEDTAQAYGFTRENQDQYARSCLNKTLKAYENNLFDPEIIPLEAQGEMVVQDECPFKVKPDKIGTLKPAFKSDGTVTAASSSAIADGAAAVVMMHENRITNLGIKPRAWIVASASHGEAPNRFTVAPVGAIQKLLNKTGWSLEDVDLFEINEAFAVVPMGAMKDLKIPTEKVNIYGGALVLGHPLGASGARVVVTLLNALEQKNLKRGIAAICIGGGESTAIAIERM